MSNEREREAFEAAMGSALMARKRRRSGFDEKRKTGTSETLDATASGTRRSPP